MALGTGTFTALSGAVSDLFAAGADRSKGDALRIKAKGDALEGENYDLASDLALQNKQFTETSTAIKAQQLDRQNTQVLGGQQADVASGGFAASGSALDLMRDSASQGALTKAVAGQQGLITEAGYQEQAESYQNLSKAAAFAVQQDNLAADAADKAASGSTITGIIKGVAGVASLFTGVGAVGDLIPGGLGDSIQDALQDAFD